MKMKAISYFARIIRSFVSFINNVSMRKKLFAAVFIFTAIPFGTYITYSYNESTDALVEQTVFSEEKTFEQARTVINYNALNINKTMELILMDETIHDVLYRCIQEFYPTIDQIRDFLKLKDKFISLEKNQDVGRIRIYVKNGLLFSSENKHFYEMDKAKESIWYQKLHTSKVNSIWGPPSYMDEEGAAEELITYIRILKNPNNYQEDIGILRIDIDEKRIKKVLSDAMVISSSHVALVNTAGDIISSTEGFENLYAGDLKEDLLNTAKSKKDLDDAFKGVLDKQEYLLQFSEIQGTDWFLLSMSPYQDIIGITNKLRNEMVLLLMGVVALSYIMSYVISHTITKRIFKLKRQMDRVKGGDLNIRILSAGKDEVGELSSTFNYMVVQMRDYMEEKERLGEIIKNSEFKALQAQINPHFLYNTLDLIHWQAMEHNVPSVSAIVQTLAKFYKMSLSRGDEIITVLDELEMVRSYVRIQNMRFKDSIQFVEEGMEALYDYKVPKIILQPIIENAILHGIRRKKDAMGQVLVKGTIYDRGILIEVIDDGVGFTPERLDEVRSGDYESTDTGSGYGLKNINSRLALQYGEEYGLEIHSSLGVGTHCYVRIPHIK
ncbi:two-component system sensor histidine kinase YesM [Anaerotaenia torta]|uniref:sensor histidine kinase n=1 Tax=Anaerotaenia torta TaxID=433293 RepID=UPI003D21D339